MSEVNYWSFFFVCRLVIGFVFWDDIRIKFIIFIGVGEGFDLVVWVVLWVYYGCFILINVEGLLLMSFCNDEFLY